MPLIIPKDLPAYEELQQENVFVMHQERAMSQHIRPLRILILNLMPTKIVTETQLARLLANSPLQVQVTFLQTATHSTTHTAPEHMKAFYKTFDEIKNERFDGMIITGAPIEDLDYEDVDYWDELCRIMDYTKENVYSTIHLCWGALAGLYYHFGIPKVHLDKKMFGVFEHRVTRPSNPLVRGFDEVFYAPHSRHTEVRAEDIAAVRRATEGHILKVIIECCFLTDEEKIKMCEIVTASGAEYIKTSTGFGGGGATREDVALFKAHVAPHVKIKAAGGIANLDDARDFVALGADRLGTSRIVKAVKAMEQE